ncbi:hypothetical protein JAAARDRAFT_546310 [Jaapia argillacea MUCL 33604]|uniref:Uncharacterized protein n=1 Tax=Jaapia argillacea MUCL 33604 TaxID=933084 RepID=A0A067PKB2_9AGAM|nr:hypothetical protein JAAARDRAFT_546310 [Jaapia argillacea MUCL 33604]
MARRPTSSAGRPFTADAFRPNTARPSTSTAQGGFYDHDPQYTYSHDDYIEEDEDEESEEEDVFAYLPPSTAEQQEQQHQDTVAEGEDARVAAAEELQHNMQLQLDSAQQAHDPPPLVYDVTVPPSSFDPYSPRYHPVDPADVFPPPPIHSIPVESPPSTDSHHTDDPYRLRRVNHVSTPSTAASLPPRPSLSSREVHVALPSGDEKMIVDEERGDTSKSKEATGSLAETASLSISPSLLDDESRDGGSIK